MESRHASYCRPVSSSRMYAVCISCVSHLSCQWCSCSPQHDDVKARHHSLSQILSHFADRRAIQQLRAMSDYTKGLPRPQVVNCDRTNL